MARDWKQIDKHYQQLLNNVNRELASPHHTRAAQEAVREFCQGLDFESVVELGCATGPVLDEMKKMGKKTLGVTLKDEPNNNRVTRQDMHFTNIPDRDLDMAVTRHVLEHSPMPLLLLMEMHRIAQKYALVILPTPTVRMISTWKDHYFVMPKTQWEKLFITAGFEILNFKTAKYLEYEKDKWDEEYRWLLKVV